MTTRKLIHMFVGVPDEMLRSIGLIVVLSAPLDFKRMQLFEAADQIPVTTSADWPRRRVTENLLSAFSAPLFARQQQQVATWLQEGDSLFDFRDDLVHSVGAYEVRGNGVSRFIREHPRNSRVKQRQVIAEELDTVVMRLHDVTFEGVGLLLDTIFLIEHGPEAHANYVKQREDLHAEQQRALDAAEREIQQQAPEQ
jgi:hypothetical protein